MKEENEIDLVDNEKIDWEMIDQIKKQHFLQKITEIYDFYKIPESDEEWGVFIMQNLEEKELQFEEIYFFSNLISEKNKILKKHFYNVLKKRNFALYIDYLVNSLTIEEDIEEMEELAKILFEINFFSDSFFYFKKCENHFALKNQKNNEESVSKKIENFKFMSSQCEKKEIERKNEENLKLLRTEIKKLQKKVKITDEQINISPEFFCLLSSFKHENKKIISHMSVFYNINFKEVKKKNFCHFIFYFKFVFLIYFFYNFYFFFFFLFFFLFFIFFFYYLFLE